MSAQAARQAARRAALDAQAKRRRDRAERDKRLEAIAVRVLVALAERDESVAATEQRAGEALHELTEVEGLSVREAVSWCADKITMREAARLRRLAAEQGAADVHSSTGQ